MRLIIFETILISIVVLEYIFICNIGRIRHSPYMENIRKDTKKVEVYFYEVDRIGLGTYVSYKFIRKNNKWKYEIKGIDIFMSFMAGFIILMFIIVFANKGFFKETEAIISIILITLLGIFITLYKPLRAYVYFKKHEK